MLHPDLFHFLLDLKENNNKPWFDENRARYQSIRESIIAYMEEVIRGITFDTDVMGISASKTLFRINRDIRFSKNKNPYKTNLGAEISPAKSKSDMQPGYYIHFEPEGCFFAGGLYMPDSAQLQAVRQHIDLHAKDLRAITQHPDFVKTFGELKGDRLKSAPKGYDKSHPDLDLLAMKAMYVVHKFEPERVYEADFVDYTLGVLRNLYPLTHFLREALNPKM